MTTTTAPVDASVRQLADDAVTMTTNTPKSVAKQDDSFVVILDDGQQVGWSHLAVCLAVSVAMVTVGVRSR